MAKKKVNRGSKVSRRNAAEWNAKGYEQWRKGDAAREQAHPIGQRVERKTPRR